ncbi:uncharacterized protein LOC124893359, partial [Capsicum annuum]|uniref:uncharacterized protein LOC124893359 n=1 Tax=Capsicum annuum TaxID=4072 RepID=UPI001FB16226
MYFMKGEEVLLKISPMKGVMQFGKRGKLSPRCIGPLEIFQRVGSVTYRLKLSPNDNLSYEEEPATILERDIRKLRTKDIASVKVQWKNRPIEEDNWETKAD